MYRSQYLDGGHPEGADPRIDLPDQLEHRYCNRRAGQATAQRRRNTSIFKQSRRWLA